MTTPKTFNEIITEAHQGTPKELEITIRDIASGESLTIPLTGCLNLQSVNDLEHYPSDSMVHMIRIGRTALHIEAYGLLKQPA